MDNPSQQNLNQLAIGTILGDFKITGIVGEGGFGIVYLAYEQALDRIVAIKEYLPSSIAGRTGNQSVMVRSQLNSNAFASGLKNFLREAQLLARFSHPAMVEVHRVWEQNSTAYMAMRFYDGKTLRELRQGTTAIDELYIRRLMEPIFDAVTLLHAQSVIHRDVSPDNILMRANGAPVLLDLGAARLVVGGMTQALTTILKPGYAPIEQYVDDGTMRQGPWTDVYGLGAVLYFLLTGGAPPQAVARMINDPLRTTMATAVKVPVPAYFVDAVVKALAVRPDDRFQQVDELREALQWDEPLAPEPRTSYVRIDATKNAATAASATATASLGADLQKQPTLPPVAAPIGQPAQPTQPAVAVATKTADTTFAWPAPADDESTMLLPASAAMAVSAAAKVSSPPAALSSPDSSLSSIGAARPTAPSNSGSRLWIVGALAALLVGGGYMAMNRGGTGSTPTSAVPPIAAVSDAAKPIEPSAVTAPAATSAPATTTTVPTEPVKAVAVAAAPPAPKPPIEAPAAPVVATVDKAALAALQREAEEKAKAKAEEKALAAKTKAEAVERNKALAKTEADERALATARADAEEKARTKARIEEDERQAALKAKAEAERLAKAAAAATPPAATGLAVAPSKRTVEELSAVGKAAFSRGEISAAKAAWTELVNHPDAQARSKAITYNNLAVSCCQAGDEVTCERYYASMFRADRAYSAEVSERELPQFKRAYDRAARAARAQ